MHWCTETGGGGGGRVMNEGKRQHGDLSYLRI